MEVLHAFVDVVFLAHFRSEVVSHLIASVCAQSLVILLRCQVLGDGATFFTKTKRNKEQIRKDDSMDLCRYTYTEILLFSSSASFLH